MSINFAALPDPSPSEPLAAEDCESSVTHWHTRQSFMSRNHFLVVPTAHEHIAGQAGAFWDDDDDDDDDDDGDTVVPLEED